MKIRIKTPLIEVETEDNPLVGSDNYTKRSMPDFKDCIEKAITEAIKLHNAVEQATNQ